MMNDQSENDYEHYLAYYVDQTGDGMSVYTGRRFVPTGQSGDGLGDLFRAARPALLKFARNAGKRVLSAGANVLREAVSGGDVKAAAKSSFMDAGLGLLDDTMNTSNSHTRGTKSGRVSKKKGKKRSKNIFDN